jgi:hypothetical protein
MGEIASKRDVFERYWALIEGDFAAETALYTGEQIRLLMWAAFEMGTFPCSEIIAACDEIEANEADGVKAAEL